MAYICVLPKAGLDLGAINCILLLAGEVRGCDGPAPTGLGVRYRAGDPGVPAGGVGEDET